MNVKFKMTPGGEVAIVPRAEYERLKLIEQETREDAGAARLIARARQDIAGGALLIPKSVLDQLANGDNPVRTLRQFRGETQAEVATGVGITQHYLSELETGKRKGPFELHQKIARYLGVPFDLLASIAVSPSEADPERFVIRQEGVAAVRRSRGQR